MSLRTAFAYTIAARGAALILMATGFAVLGRILPPEAFGYFAIAVAIYALAEIATQFGLRQLVISRQNDHSRDEIAAAAGLSLLIAIGLCLTGLAAASTLGGWIIPPPVATALVPLSFALLIGPFTLGTEALLQRSMRFGLISVESVLRVAVDVSVAVTLALSGAGAAALAGGMLASHMIGAAFIVTYGGPELRVVPRLRPALGAWRDLRGWGQRLTIMQVLPKLSSLAMIATLSTLQGAVSLGVFNRAQTIHQMLDKSLLDGIKPVILPAFSTSVRTGADPRQIYRVKLDYLTALCWPTFALIALLAEDFVSVLLGTGWAEAVPVVQILALMGIGLPATKMSQKLFVALGETAAFLRIEATREAIRLPLAMVGAFLSLEGFALAYVAGGWIKAVGITRHLHDLIGGPEGGHLPIVLRAAGLTLASLAGPGGVVAADFSAPATLVLSMPLALGGWLGAVILLRHPVIVELRSAALRIRGLLGV